MTNEIVTVPCLDDNYAYIIHNHIEKTTCLIDAPESKPIIEVLKKRQWKLEKIVLTHHHADHVMGLDDILKNYPSKVAGAAADINRLPKLDETLKENDIFYFGNIKFLIMEVSGHTIGHIALYSKEIGAVFTGDSLMTLGCGKLFEGSPEIMLTTLKKFIQLPPETKVYSGHEYGEKNANFAMSIDTKNENLKKRLALIKEQRLKNIATVPSTIKIELETNPFLRVGNSEIKSALNMQECQELSVFAELRSRRDHF